MNSDSPQACGNGGRNQHDNDEWSPDRGREGGYCHSGDAGPPGEFLSVVERPSGRDPREKHDHGRFGPLLELSGQARPAKADPTESGGVGADS